MVAMEIKRTERPLFLTSLFIYLFIFKCSSDQGGWGRGGAARQKEVPVGTGGPHNDALIICYSPKRTNMDTRNIKIK